MAELIFNVGSLREYMELILLVEILDLHHFKEIKEKGNRFIAITDKNLPKNCVHHT